MGNEKSTRGIGGHNDLEHSDHLYIGGRIQQRLEALGWKQKDLLDRVPDLSAQSLSNLIRRDSVRSELDVVIAEALGVSVMWLVYGDDQSAIETTQPGDSSVLSDLAALEPEDADVWRAQIRAAAIKARKQHAGCIPDRCHVIAVSARAVTANK